MNYLTFCLSYDYPEAFWLKSSFKWSYSASWGYSDVIPSNGSGVVSYEQNLVLVLKTDDGFDMRIDELQTPQLVNAAVSEYNEKVLSAISLCGSGSRNEQVCSLNDWLTKHNCYNSLYGYSSSVPTIAWSPLSALRESTGETGPVCEGYARAFKILCDQLSIPCVLVTGNAKATSSSKEESHMWNEVQIEDGNWCAVDVTWNDPVISGIDEKTSGYENHFWFLLG